MPNWCDNSVTLYNEDVEKVSALAEEMGKENEEGKMIACPFQHLRPRPADQEENWGTKWDASIIDWERRDDNEIWISFDSAWAPPITLYDYLTENGWNVEAIYHESGMNFAGQYNNGIDNYYEYDVSDPDFLHSLPGEIIEFANLFDAHDEYIMRELEENWADAKRSEWNKVKHKPQIEGWYEVSTKAWDYPHFLKFKDGEWDTWDPKNVIKWRGLAEKPAV
jgi:hypothetical protein